MNWRFSFGRSFSLSFHIDLISFYQKYYSTTNAKCLCNRLTQFITTPIAQSADLQGAARSGENHLQPEPGTASSSPSIASNASSRRWRWRQWSRYAIPSCSTANVIACAIRSTAATSATDPRAQHRRQTTVVHHLLMAIMQDERAHVQRDGVFRMKLENWENVVRIRARAFHGYFEGVEMELYGFCYEDILVGFYGVLNTFHWVRFVSNDFVIKFGSFLDLVHCSCTTKCWRITPFEWCIRLIVDRIKQAHKTGLHGQQFFI